MNPPASQTLSHTTAGIFSPLVPFLLKHVFCGFNILSAGAAVPDSSLVKAGL